MNEEELEKLDKIKKLAISRHKSKDIELKSEFKQKYDEISQKVVEKQVSEIILQIPQISIGQFKIKPLTELDTTVNIVKTEEKSLKIPQLDLAKFTLNLNKIIDLDTAILIERKTDEKLLIPQFRLKEFKPITAISNLDMKFSITVEKQSSLKIPKLVLTKFRPIKPYERFLTDKPVQIQQLTVDYSKTGEVFDQSGEYKKVGVQMQESKVSPEEKIKEEVTESIAESSSESGEYKLEDFEFFDLIFSRGGGTLDFDEPLIICIEEPSNDSYIGTIRTLCKLIYREKIGGYPRDRSIIETINELKEELRWIEAESKMLSVKLSEKEWTKLTKEDWIRLWSRIKELFAQGFGVIIFNRWLDYVGEHLINIVKLKPRNLPPEVRKEIVELFWGVSVSEDDASKPFDLLFEIARKKKERLLKKLESLENGIYWDATKEDENESKEHRLIKAFIVRLIMKDLRNSGLKLKTPTEIERYVKTECWISNSVRADVYVDGKVFEVETLFAEDRGGKTIRDKLRETFKKYENTDIKEINVVLDNPTFIRHVGTILSLLRNYKDWMNMKQKIVRFYTIDIENERLIPLEEVVNMLKEIIKC